MNRILTYLFFAVIIISCTNPDIETDRELLNLRGSAKSLKLLKLEYIPKQHLTRMVPWTIDYYNQDGYKIKHEYYQQNVLQYTKYYSYNKRNQLVSEKSVNPVKSNTWEYISRYKYNLKGFMIKETQKNLKNPSDITIFRYKYDSKGNLLEEKESEIDDNFIERHEYNYGNRGLKSEERIFNNGKLTDYYKYTYNIEGQLIKTLHKDYQASYDNITTKYDENGNIIEQNSYENRELAYQLQYWYDRYGNVTLEKNYGKYTTGTTKRYDYKYDRYNNWIELECYIDGAFTYKLLREIEYY